MNSCNVLFLSLTRYRSQKGTETRACYHSGALILLCIYIFFLSLSLSLSSSIQNMHPQSIQFVEPISEAGSIQVYIIYRQATSIGPVCKRKKKEEPNPLIQTTPSNSLHMLFRPHVKSSFYNFAASLTSPIFSLGLYFLRTPSLWYYPNRTVSCQPLTQTSCLTTRVTTKGTKTNLPKLLRRILPRDALQDLRAARVLVDEVGDVVDAAVDDDVEALVGRVVRGDVGGGELLRHFSFFSCLPFL